jgi:hypothetical protein
MLTTLTVTYQRIAKAAKKPVEETEAPSEEAASEEDPTSDLDESDAKPRAKTAAPKRKAANQPEPLALLMRRSKRLKPDQHL